jgi:hypothetical protein
LTHAWKEFEPIVAATPVAPQVRQQPAPFAAPPVLSSAAKDFETIVAAEPVLPPAQLVPHKFVAMQHTPVFPKVRPEPEPVAAPASEIPWLTETPTYGTALEQLGKAHALHTRLGLWETELAGEGGKETAVAAEETARATPSRLSGLRGLFLALGLKEEKHAAPEASETETAPAPQPERAVFVQDFAPVPAPPEQTVPAQTFVPVPEHEPLFAADSGNGARKDSTRRVTAEPEFLPPKPLKPAHRDRSEAFDDVQILPSWRGQYKGKD